MRHMSQTGTNSAQDKHFLIILIQQLRLYGTLVEHKYANTLNVKTIYEGRNSHK